MKHTKKKIENGYNYRGLDITKDSKKWKCNDEIFKTLTLAQKHIDNLLDGDDVQNSEKNEQTEETCSTSEQTLTLPELMKKFMEENELPRPTIFTEPFPNKVYIRYKFTNIDHSLIYDIRDKYKDDLSYGLKYGINCYFTFAIYPDNDIFISIYKY